MSRERAVGIERREQMLKFITDYKNENGWAPSRREMADQFGMTPASVQFHVEALVREGRLRRAPGIPRGIVITGAAMKDGEVTM